MTPEQIVELLYRRHLHSMHRFARTLVRADEVDDVVAQAFANVLRAMRNGHGPTDDAVSYLFTTVRYTALALVQRRGRSKEVPLPDAIDLFHRDLVHHDDDPFAGDDAATRALSTLSPHHRIVLWETVVEGTSPAELSIDLGLSANATAALGYRARAALRRAFEGR